MGTTYHTYVGPYVRCTITMVDKHKETVSCPKTSCKNHGRFLYGDSYCPLCGTRIQPIVVAYRADSVDQWDVSEQIKERLCSASGDTYLDWKEEHLTHLWKPNVTMSGRDGHLESRCGFSVASITASQVSDEIAAFVEFFKKELSDLRAAYGADAVAIDWGIIQDYN